VYASKMSVSRMTFGSRDWRMVWAWHCEVVECVVHVRSSDDNILRDIVIVCVVVVEFFLLTLVVKELVQQRQVVF
jgi:hypothetical protein